MRFLEAERRTLAQLLPGLDEALTAVPRSGLESPGGSGLSLFKEAGGPGLLVPAEYKGIGASAVQAVQVQRAVATRSPSLAVATTMHHFSVAALWQAYLVGNGLEWLLLEAVATQRLLMASGFAEGRTGQSILASSITARQEGTDLILNGSKKPCSLSASMDLLTASLLIDTADGPQLAVAVVPAATEGVSIHPFWSSFVLAGAESDEVRLTDVRVPDSLIVRTELGADRTLDRIQTVGFLWFELMMAASYLGMASILAEQVLVRERGSAEERARLIVDLESAMGGVLGAAAAFDATGPDDEPDLARALICRFAAQEAIDRVVPRCLEALGGMSYVGDSENAYVAACCAALKFHPPSRAFSAAALCDAYGGGPLVLG